MSPIARGHFNGWAIDNEGNAIAGASVYVYDNDTTTPVGEDIFRYDTGDNTTLANPITTANDGFFEFFLDAPIEVTLKISKSGYEDRTFRADVINASLSSGVTDHGALTGLADDDHPQYVLESLVDAAGDLLVGTAADTLARLAKGTALQVLRVNAGATALEYATPAAFSGCAMGVTAGGTVSNGSSSVVPWNSFAYEETDNYGTSGDDFFTIPATAIYRITFQAAFYFAASSTGSFEATVAANSDLNQGLLSHVDYPPASAGYKMLGGVRDVSLTAGDTIRLYMREDTTTTATIGTPDELTFFSIQRLTT